MCEASQMPPRSRPLNRSPPRSHHCEMFDSIAELRQGFSESRPKQEPPRREVLGGQQPATVQNQPVSFAARHNDRPEPICG